MSKSSAGCSKVGVAATGSRNFDVTSHITHVECSCSVHGALMLYGYLRSIAHFCFLLPPTTYTYTPVVTITVRTPTLCIPDTSDRPGYFFISLSNLAMPLITYGAPCITLPCSTFIATLLHI